MRRIFLGIPGPVREALPALVVFSLLLLPFLRHLPILDGFLYYECLKQAVHGPEHFHGFACINHPSLLFMGLYALPEYFFPGKAIAIQITTMLLGGLSIVAFSSILRILVPSRGFAFVRALTSLLYASQPVVIASTPNFTLDVGLTFIFFPFLLCLLRKQYGFAALLGILLTFTKETGLILYCLTLLLWFFVFLVPRHISLLRAFRALLAERWLFVPVFLIGLYMAVQISLLHSYPFHEYTRLSFVSRLFALTVDRRLLVLLGEVFFAQFRWIQTLILLAGAAVFLRHSSGRKRLIGSSMQARSTLFITLLYITGALLLTRLHAYNNPRYFMVLYPLGSALVLVCLRFLIGKGKLILLYLLLILSLNVPALLRSNDPVSELLLGSFPFGRHRLYAMTVATDDRCCGFGQDQLIYNLEYTKLLVLLEEALQWIHPTATAIVVTYPIAYSFLWNTVDPVTFRFSQEPGSLHIHSTGFGALLERKRLPEEIYYIEFPNFFDTANLETLRKSYATVEMREFQSSGYAMRAYRMRLRGKNGLP